MLSAARIFINSFIPYEQGLQFFSIPESRRLKLYCQIRSIHMEPISRGNLRNFLASRPSVAKKRNEALKFSNKMLPVIFVFPRMTDARLHCFLYQLLLDLECLLSLSGKASYSHTFSRPPQKAKKRGCKRLELTWTQLACGFGG